MSTSQSRPVIQIAAPLPTSTLGLTTSAVADTSQALTVTGQRIRLNQQIANANVKTLTPGISWSGGTLNTITGVVDHYASSSVLTIWGFANTALDQAPSSPYAGNPIAVANTGGFVLSVTWELYFAAVSTVILTPRWQISAGTDSAYYRFTQATVLD